MFQNIKDKRTLDSYLIPETKISIKDIYALYNEQVEILQTYSIQNIKLVFRKIDSIFLYIKVEETNIQLLLYPIKIKFSNGKIFQEYDFFSPTQFYSLTKELNIDEPQIIYKKNNIEF